MAVMRPTFITLGPGRRFPTSPSIVCFGSRMRSIQLSQKKQSTATLPSRRERLFGVPTGRVAASPGTGFETHRVGVARTDEKIFADHRVQGEHLAVIARFDLHFAAVFRAVVRNRR